MQTLVIRERGPTVVQGTDVENKTGGGRRDGGIMGERERCRENRRERLVAVPKLGPKILGYDQFARASLLKLGEWEIPRISAASREVCWAIKAGQAAVVDY